MRASLLGSAAATAGTMAKTMAVAMAAATAVATACASLLSATPAAAAAANPVVQQRVEQGGIAIELAIEPLGESTRLQEGEPARFSFFITDTTTHTPLSGVFPAAWMDLRPPGEAKGATPCQKKIEAFIGGGLLNPPELDLNVYYVLAMNQDATISVVDPLFGFGTTKLLDMVFLDAPGEDWVLSPDGDRLFISLPDADQVAVVDTSTWELVAQVATPPGPRRLVLEENGRLLWVTVAGSAERPAGIVAIDTGHSQVAAHLPLGELPADLVLGTDDLRLYTTLRDSGQLVIIDTVELEILTRLDLGGSPASLGFSALADTVYAVDGDAGAISAVDGKQGKVVARIEAEPGLGAIFVAPEGRLAFVVNGPEDLLHIVDTASNRLVQTGPVEDDPDQIAFSDHLAYVRHRGSEIVLMIPLLQVGKEGEPIPVVDFPGGHTPFGRVSRPSSAPGIVQAPGATAVLVANPADRAIYYYKEGMAAPMGHFQNYGREPRAVLALDRSLAERRDGAYETAAVLRRPGSYDLAFFLDAPRTVICFEVQVEPNPVLQARRAEILTAALELVDKPSLTLGRSTTVRFRLVHSVTGDPISGLDDLRVTTFRGPGLEQTRRWARPLLDGTYQIDLLPSRPGLYRILASSASAGLSPERAEPLSLWIPEPGQTAAAPAGNPRSSSNNTEP